MATTTKLEELKVQAGVANFEFAYLKDMEDKTKRATDPKTNQPTQWLRHWDNTNRVQIVVHEDTAKAIKAKPDMANLALMDKGTQKGTKGEYALKVLIMYEEADFTF